MKSAKATESSTVAQKGHSTVKRARLHLLCSFMCGLLCCLRFSFERLLQKQNEVIFHIFRCSRVRLSKRVNLLGLRRKERENGRKREKERGIFLNLNSFHCLGFSWAGVGVVRESHDHCCYGDIMEGLCLIQMC